MTLEMALDAKNLLADHVENPRRASFQIDERPATGSCRRTSWPTPSSVGHDADAALAFMDLANLLIESREKARISDAKLPSWDLRLSYWSRLNLLES